MANGASVFNIVFERSANPMVICDDDHRVVRINPAAVRLFGRDPTGEVIDQLVVPEEREAFAAGWRLLMETGDVIAARHMYGADGRPVHVNYIGRAHIAPGLHLGMALGEHEGEEEPADDRARLTPRETEVVGRLALGETGEEVARQLHLSPETVRTHIRNAMAKLGARTRAHLIVRAIEEGLVRV